MPKSLVLGNGSLLVTLDMYAQVRDFYFPYVGLENHAGSFHTHKIGVWVGGEFSWIDDSSWSISINYQDYATMLSDISAENSRLGVRLHFSDIVYNEKNLFVRNVTVENTGDKKRQIKLFFHQQFQISESHRGDSAYYDPKENIIVHYKGSRVFLINAKASHHVFEGYSIGNFGIEGKEGTYKDAEDGILSLNPVEHGMVDSVISVEVEVEKESAEEVYYWVAAAESLGEAISLNRYCLEKTPRHLIRTTRDFWRAWVKLADFHFGSLDPKLVEVFQKSLLIMRTHVDDQGAIIASADTDILHIGRDAYWYMWPRDGAVVAMALDKIGDTHCAEKFFLFCNQVVSEEGYFMHRYRADKSLGSSWHPWIRDGKPALPIQEDETALIIYAFWQHYKLSRDLEFMEKVYNSLIRRCAEFMVEHTDRATGLPLPSFDLWEANYGVSTYTASTVYAALLAAAEFASTLGKTDQHDKFKEASLRLQKAIIKYLFDEGQGYFYKMVSLRGSEVIPDKTIDASSAYGVFKYKVLPFDDPRLQSAVSLTRQRLWVDSPIGGMARFENDAYLKVDQSKTGNPWFITTLWYAQYAIESARNKQEMDEALSLLEWAASHALLSGIMSEQLDPNTGSHVGAAPLTWSHAEYILTVIDYIAKSEKLGLCLDCKVPFLT